MCWSKRRRSRAANHSGGSSAAAVATGLVGASVGDSEARRFGVGPPVCLTRDQLRRPLLGSGFAMPIGFKHETAGDGVLIVALDGLWKYAKLDRVAAVLKSEPAEAARALVELVRYPGGSLPDDVATAVCRITRR